jgi:flagellin
MGIRVNENILSLFVNRNLARTNTRLERAFERLSSGEKINRSGDDPSGLANSQLLRAKITGLQRNLTNCNEGINLLSVAESALGGMNDILQRLRELAIQASSSTLSDDDRLLTQTEVDSLLEEIDRIATQANYNDKNLLDGTFQNLRLQVGTRMGQSIPISIEDSRTSILGSLARVTGALSVNATPLAGLGELTINGVTVPATAYDGVSTVDGDASGLAKATAINSITYLTGVRATAEDTVYADTAASIAGGSLDGVATSLTINGTNIGAVNFLSGDTSGILRERINSFASLTGVEASLGSSGELVLTAVDGRNFEVATTGNIADELGLLAVNGDVNAVARGTVTLKSSDTIQVGGTLALIGLTAGQATTFVDAATALANLRLTTFADAQTALDTLDTAIQQVLTRRTALGSIESRVNQTIDDLMVNIENLTGADSRIRDADFAVETAEMTQAQIIQEAGVAILAQANLIPSMALSLLQNQ